MLLGEAQPLGTGVDAHRQERMIRADFIPALCWDCPIMPGKIMQGRPEGGGSFGNGLLHSTPAQEAYEPKTTGVPYPYP
jgi:hypothetical protein